MTANVLRAYLDARYWADPPGGRIALIIGRVPELPGAMDVGAGCALITACNPGSVVRSDADNEAANALLRERLTQVAATIFAGDGGSADGAWSEPSWFALGIAPEAAGALGREFGQYAILAARAHEPLELHVLDPGLGVDPGMDTRFVRWVACGADE